jgi:general secretion pathway protein G
MTHNRRSRRSGFTLLEVLLVLAILMVIAGLVLPRLIGTQQEAQIDAAKLKIENFNKQVTEYAIAHDGEYPTGSNKEVIELLMKPGEDERGNPIARYLDEVPKDPWGRTLMYEYPNTKDPNAGKPAIWSLGPNKQDEQGGGDDVKGWKDLDEQTL